jgi:hypothetical protein
LWAAATNHSAGEQKKIWNWELRKQFGGIIQIVCKRH